MFVLLSQRLKKPKTFNSQSELHPWSFKNVSFSLPQCIQAFFQHVSFLPCPNFGHEPKVRVTTHLLLLYYVMLTLGFKSMILRRLLTIATISLLFSGCYCNLLFIYCLASCLCIVAHEFNLALPFLILFLILHEFPIVEF